MAMYTSSKHYTTIRASSSSSLAARTSLRYWLPWILLIAFLAIGLDAYFDFRNRELDKRLEQINIGFRQN